MMKRILVFLLPLLLVTGCARKNGPTNPADFTLTIYPAKVGNVWAGVLTMFDTTETPGSVFPDTIWIPRDTLIGGTLYFTFLERMPKEPRPTFGDTSHWTTFHLYDGRNTFTGFVEWSPRGETLVYSYPAVVGQSNVFVVDTLIGVPAGTFRCVGYKTEALPTSGDPFGFRGYSFMCPGVGLVKSELFMSSDYSPVLYRRSTWTLETYTLK